MSTEIANVFSELGKGTFQSQLAEALNEVAQKTKEYGKAGKQGEIVIKMKFIPAGKENDQLMISSTVFKKVPTDTGHKGEDFNHETGFFFDKNGNLVTMAPEENQEGQQGLNIV